MERPACSNPSNPCILGRGMYSLTAAMPGPNPMDVSPLTGINRSVPEQRRRRQVGNSRLAWSGPCKGALAPQVGRVVSSIKLDTRLKSHTTTCIYLHLKHYFWNLDQSMCKCTGVYVALYWNRNIFLFQFLVESEAILISCLAARLVPAFFVVVKTKRSRTTAPESLLAGRWLRERRHRTLAVVRDRRERSCR
jgi:hypothetical protein